ncbi:MAG: DUF1565 domain-containing protein [Kiritimatiellae bacterium]|nr:DUF1565 domain-containing protein [Kiritimatiellia bacterium]
MHAEQLIIRTAGAVSLAILLAAGTPALGQTNYYVSDAIGDDNNAGTNWASAFKTITNAMAFATDDDTVLVTNGNYNVPMNYLAGVLTLTESCVITNGVTLRSMNGYAYTTVTGVKTSTFGGIIFYIDHANAVVDGFKITGGGQFLLHPGLYNEWHHSELLDHRQSWSQSKRQYPGRHSAKLPHHRQLHARSR